MKIATMDKKTVNVIATELEILLAKFAQDRGLEYKRSGGRFDATSFRPKVEFLIAGGAERNTNLNAELHQYKVRYGSEFKAQGGIFKVVEVTDRGKLVATNAEGKRYKFSKPEAIVPIGYVASTVKPSIEVHDTVKNTTGFDGLKADGCKCKESKFLCYPEDGCCSCGTYKHHVHCANCRGVSQWG